MVFWQVKGARMIQDRKADVKMVVEVNDYRYCVFPPPKSSKQTSIGSVINI